MRLRSAVGDFQANGVYPTPKKQMQPKELALKLVENIPQNELWETSIAGFGFVNFKLSPEFLHTWLNELGDTEETKVYSLLVLPKNSFLIFQVPILPANACGSYRSTIIGESLARPSHCRGICYSGQSSRVGGTQFGILLFNQKVRSISRNLADEPVAALEDLYRQGNAWVKKMKRLCRRQAGIGEVARWNSENSALWQKIVISAWIFWRSVWTFGC